MLLKEYLLGISKLGLAQEILADLNNDKSITANDLSEMEKLYSGLMATNPHLSSPWKFFEANQYYYQNKIMDSIDITSPFQDYHFFGIRSGDLNDSYHTTEFFTKTSILSMEDIVLNKGEEYTIAVTNKKDHRIKAFQIALKKNQNYELLEVANIDKIKIQVVDKGSLIWIIGISDDLSIKGGGYPLFNNDELFKIKILAKSNSVLHDVLSLSDESNKLITEVTREKYKLALDINGIIPASSKELEYNIEIFPNPTSNKLTVSLPSKLKSKQIVLYDFNGKQIKVGMTLDNDSSIDISELKPGFYLLKIELSNGFKLVKKIIKI